MKFYYYLFIQSKKWKKYNVEFDKLPKLRNIMGSIIVGVISILVIFGYFFSVFLIQN